MPTRVIALRVRQSGREAPTIFQAALSVPCHAVWIAATSPRPSSAIAWPELPEAIRAGILAMVKAALLNECLR